MTNTTCDFCGNKATFSGCGTIKSVSNTGRANSNWDVCAICLPKVNEVIGNINFRSEQSELPYVVNDNLTIEDVNDMIDVYVDLRSNPFGQQNAEIIDRILVRLNLTKDRILAGEKVSQDEFPTL